MRAPGESARSMFRLTCRLNGGIWISNGWVPEYGLYMLTQRSRENEGLKRAWRLTVNGTTSLSEGLRNPPCRRCVSRCGWFDGSDFVSVRLVRFMQTKKKKKTVERKVVRGAGKQGPEGCLGGEGRGEEVHDTTSGLNEDATSGLNEDATSGLNEDATSGLNGDATGGLNEDAHGAAVKTVEKKLKRAKRRLDDVCKELYPQYTKNVIQSFVVRGKVTVDGTPVLKAGTQIRDGASVVITAEIPKYVCRAGLKMEAALEKFCIDVSGRVVLDAGLSTGGFTDCLLQYGAAHVFGVDVGYGQVAEKIRVHPQVTVMERTNLRHLRSLDFVGFKMPITFVSLDVSFISTLKMRDAISDIMEAHGDVVLLIKPQFEAGKQHVGAGGVVRDASVHREVIERVVTGWEDVGFVFQNLMVSPIKGAASGNTEYLCHLIRGNRVDRGNLEHLIPAVVGGVK